MEKITATELEEWQGSGRRFSLLDVRRAKARTNDGAMIPHSQWLDPERLFTWKDEVPRDCPAVLFCAHGHEISQGCAATLRVMGLDARALIDGFTGWRDSGRPVQPLT